MTLSAVIVNDKVADRVSNSDGPTKGCFMHGPTYMGNALACSVANASLDILLENTWKKQVSHIEFILHSKLYLYVKNPIHKLVGTIVKRISIVGAVGAVELLREVNPVKFQKWIMARGVNIRPFRNLIYIMPPYIISDSELEVVIHSIIEFLHLLQKGDLSFYLT